MRKENRKVLSPLSSFLTLISLVYDSNQDSLDADKQANSLRRKISTKFTPKIQLANSKNNKEISKPILVQIECIPPSIPVKSQKEVNTILKYFNSRKLDNKSKPTSKSYAQASKQNISISEVIKIKKTFSSINAKKINQINNIVKGNSKPKPHIQMTTKGLLRKQVIIPIGKENISNFMKNSLLHVTNINKLLRNAKYEVLVDFIHLDPLGIIVVTNKVFLQSDLQLIKNILRVLTTSMLSKSKFLNYLSQNCTSRS